MFGSLKRDDVKEETPSAEAQQQGAPKDERQRCQENCTKSMQEKERMAFIQQEFQSGDLNEDEYKELMSVFSST
jgi:hypothetical protein